MFELKPLEDLIDAGSGGAEFKVHVVWPTRCPACSSIQTVTKFNITVTDKNAFYTTWFFCASCFHEWDVSGA